MLERLDVLDKEILVILSSRTKETGLTIYMIRQKLIKDKNLEPAWMTVKGRLMKLLAEGKCSRTPCKDDLTTKTFLWYSSSGNEKQVGDI